MSERPDRPEYRHSLAMCYMKLGFSTSAEVKESLKYHRLAASQMEELVADFPTRPESRHSLAVTVGNRDWDTHDKNFSSLKDTLLPPLDQGMSALLEDLSSRGLLDETLVVWMGDMGRTPRINGNAGRDHWSFCYSIVLAGGGIRGGQVYGSSDRSAAYPSTNPVSPADLAATIYHCLGIDPHTQITDQQGRPLMLGEGKPLEALLG